MKMMVASPLLSVLSMFALVWTTSVDLEVMTLFTCGRTATVIGQVISLIKNWGFEIVFCLFDSPLLATLKF